MIKVLLADDEKLIREGLKTIIEWEQLGYKIVEAAKDGDECLSFLLKYRPDICILDIRMPGRTGLEVIKEIRSMGINTHFIILSGYKNFGYAKQALNYHADNYLLKPLDEEELIQTLSDISNIITADKSDNPSKRERMIKTYFRSYLGLSTEKQPNLDSHEIEWSSYQLLLLNFPKEMNTRVEDWLRENDLGIFLLNGNPNIILLRNYYLRAAGIKTINRLFSDFLNGYKFDGCIATAVQSIDQLPDVMDEVEDLMDRRFFSTLKGITSKLYFKVYPKLDNNKLDLESHIATTQKLIEVGNEHRIKLELDNFSHKMINGKYTEAMVKDWYCKLTLGSLAAVLNDNKLTKNNIAGNCEIIMEIQSCSRLYELEDKITNILCSAIDKQDIQSSQTLIKNMKFIVENHYIDNLKLKDLSLILNYNSAYLGKVFKLEVGESFSVYLDKYRVLMAKKYLTEGYKVYQAAEKVGYTYVDYFHTKFKKYVGMSPLEYRKQNN